MKRVLFLFFGLSNVLYVNAQQNSASIYAQIKKLGVVGSVLYIAAHPDDENNSFLPYLTQEKNYRTAYLSLTRGDGGQNLIGKEQGVELGMIRTQELLAARAQDGAEQYFSTAYEFGFSKSAQEALKIWDHQKVLSDVVWVIRQYQPDIIITRFPGDARAGHGHHAASAIIANEAFKAAADPTQFPEQLQHGVTIWKAKRILWNTFNFGNINTTSNTQLKLEVGGYNPLLGKSYGEIGAEARTMHKSQGEGRPRRRGPIYEFFETTGGEAPIQDLMDGIDISWNRLEAASIQTSINDIIKQYQFDQPAASVPSLTALYQQISALPNSVWKQYKLNQVKEIIRNAAGIYFEAITQKEQVIPGDSLSIQVLFNQRALPNLEVQSLSFPFSNAIINKFTPSNQNLQWDYSFKVPNDQVISQPYWLERTKSEGMFQVKDLALIGKPESDPAFKVTINTIIAGQTFEFSTPVQYKYTDPTKGDLYQPLAIVPAVEVQFDKDVYLMRSDTPIDVSYRIIDHKGKTETVHTLVKDPYQKINLPANALYRKTIQYDHIPTLNYFPNATTKIVKLDVQTHPAKVGYIEGAGDKLPEALIALGYQVQILKASDINLSSLQDFDAVVVGIRAYNMFDYLSEKNEILNNYIKAGGNLIVQYLKSNQVGIQKVKVGPYAFTVNPSKRVTQEEATVDFLLPNHPVLNHPNRIVASDFNNWVQERSTYQAENIDAHFEMPLSMHDDSEPATNGSLLIAPYGKGNMVYLSLTLFRQLPAGNPGAYKLMANLIELPKH